MLAEDMGRFFYDPLGWVLYAFEWGVGELEGFDGPDDWQREFLDDWGDAIKRNNFDGVRPVEAYQAATSSGHGIGKSALSSWIILFIMSTRPYCKGVVTANTSEQLRTKTWGELGKWRKRCITGHWFVYNNGKGNMNLYHGDHPESWRVDGQTCREENSESFAGLHAANSTPFYLFDEASAVPDKIWEVAEGGLTDGEPFWFVFGNPTRNSGRFHACFGRFRHRWRTRQIDSRQAKMTNKVKIEQWRTDYGEESDFFKVRVRGQFPSASVTQFIPGDSVTEARKREAHVFRHEPLILGVDVARFGDDSSVLCRRRGRDARSLPWLRFPQLDTMQLAARVAELIDQHKRMGDPIDAIFVDGGGVGGGVIDRLRQLGHDVIEVNFGGKASLPRYFNKAAEMWDLMKNALGAGLAIPDEQDIEDELVGREYSYTSDNKIQLESKRDMKERGLASPDNADALSLTYAYPVAPRPETMPAGHSHGSASRDYDPHNR